jgi:hypothetical protein
MSFLNEFSEAMHCFSLAVCTPASHAPLVTVTVTVTVVCKQLKPDE